MNENIKKVANYPITVMMMLVGMFLVLIDMLAAALNGKFVQDETGSSNVIGVIISTIILLYVAIILVGQFQTQADEQMNSGALANDTQAQAAYDNAKSSGWGAINLMGMYPYILGAVAILGVVVMISR